MDANAHSERAPPPFVPALPPGLVFRLLRGDGAVDDDRGLESRQCGRSCLRCPSQGNSLRGPVFGEGGDFWRRRRRNVCRCWLCWQGCLQGAERYSGRQPTWLSALQHHPLGADLTRGGGRHIPCPALRWRFWRCCGIIIHPWKMVEFLRGGAHGGWYLLTPQRPPGFQPT